MKLGSEVGRLGADLGASVSFYRRKTGLPISKVDLKGATLSVQEVKCKWCWR
jgi:hypothetical protein